MKIYLGADHAGYNLKEEIKDYLKAKGYQVSDEGAYKYNEGDDYPDYMKVVALQVASEPDSFGIIFGGSGQGEAIAANRFNGVRAAVYYGPAVPHTPVDAVGATSTDSLEIVRLSREHNNANILSIGARFVTPEQAKQAIDLWLASTFPGDERHVRRIKKLDGEVEEENVF